jgi:hypothetical protein
MGMYFQEKKPFDAINSLAEKYFIFAFGLLFYTSWIYELVVLGDEYTRLIFQAKNAIILAFMLLVVNAISWKRATFDVLSICVVVWIALCVVSWWMHPGADHLYLRRIGQAIFTYLFVTYLRQRPQNNPFSPPLLGRWFSPWYVIAGVAAIIVLSFLNILFEDVLRGFGNSRVNFSIWLMQLVAIMFLLRPKLNNKSDMFEVMRLLLIITPVYVLQNMTGGRSGMLGTVLITAYFSYRRAGYKALFLSIVWLLVVSGTFSLYSPLVTPENNLNAFRNLPVSSMSSFGDVVAWLDRLSSGRISLIVTAFGSLDLGGFLFGVGIGEFRGWIPIYPALGMIEVHNVFLKVLGEFGILGFITILVWLIPPVLRQAEDELHSTAKYLQLIYFIVAMVHPDLMVTAINTSFLYLAFLATSLAPSLAIKDDKSGITGAIGPAKALA